MHSNSSPLTIPFPFTSLPFSDFYKHNVRWLHGVTVNMPDLHLELHLNIILLILSTIFDICCKMWAPTFLHPFILQLKKLTFRSPLLSPTCSCSPLILYPLLYSFSIHSMTGRTGGWWRQQWPMSTPPSLYSQHFWGQAWCTAACRAAH